MSRVNVLGALALAGSFLVAGVFAAAAHAQVTEPNGKVVPVPVGTNETMLVMSRGFPADAVTLPGLFGYRGETIDFQKDAHTTPGAFSPLCGFTGQMVIRGGGCKLDFAWYNATDPPMGTPSASDLHVLIPKTAYTDPNGYACSGSLTDFCPLATHMTSQAQNTFVDKVYDSGAIRNDPNYKGGLVGFAIIGDPSSQCKETHYSQVELNPTTDLSNDQHWITSLVWQSTATPDSYYIGFEDFTMTAQNWTSGANDGDFNDFVFYLTGLTCKGGGQPCTVDGAQGACAIGKTNCSEDGTTTTCHAVYTPHDEICDNLDNDCDGFVDNETDPNKPLCPKNEVCDKGNCVPNCTSGEFPCISPLVCDSQGHCVDPSCANVTCDAGTVCRSGSCVDACTGVTCPLGQECILGRCIDPCQGVTCDGNNVCEKGVCLAPCTCRTCEDGQTCSPSGKCVDMGCDTMQCPTGQVCSKGACIDACANVSCPGGATCVNGVCGDPPASTGGSTTGTTGSGGTDNTGTIIQITTGSNGSGVSGTSGSGASGSESGIDTGTRATSTSGRSKGGTNGCTCTTAGGGRSRGRAASHGLASGLVLALASLRFSRRHSRRKGRSPRTSRASTR